MMISSFSRKVVRAQMHNCRKNSSAWVALPIESRRYWSNSRRLSSMSARSGPASLSASVPRSLLVFQAAQASLSSWRSAGLIRTGPLSS